MNERLDALRSIWFAITQDARRQIEKMVAEGWDRDLAAEATVDWWTRCAEDCAREGAGLERIDDATTD